MWGNGRPWVAFGSLVEFNVVEHLVMGTGGHPSQTSEGKQVKNALCGAP
jgi:hypothetical protein